MDETVAEDSRSLVRPQSHDGVLVWQLSLLAIAHTTDDLGEISQVEGVMSLGRCRSQFRLDLIVDLNGCLHNLLLHSGNFR